MFEQVPQEMRLYRQWIVWRLEHRENAKPTKVPYNIKTGRKASVTESNDWFMFDEVASINFTCKEPVDTNTPISFSGYSGIGFVLTEHDPFAIIDLDDTHGDQEAYARQLKVYQEFNSFSELSQSGNGLHIITKGSVPKGRKRASIELYSNERYFAITGNIFGGKNVIEERQELLTILWEQMGGPAKEYTFEGDGKETETDETIIERAKGALNGEKFSKLYLGDWSEYPSQSEADFALVDIFAFYTQNRNQIRRLFANSVLGQTPKDNYAHRSDRKAYVEYMVNKSFDRQLPPLDLEAFNIKFKEEITGKVKAIALPLVSDTSVFPPGLVGRTAQYIYDNSPTPVAEIALAGAIGLIAGIAGRAYNISGTGLNQYVLILAKTGAGKEAMSAGIANLLEAIKQSVPAANDFKGPGELVSAAGLIRAFEKTPSIFSIIGEFGLKLKEMTNPHNVNAVAVKRALLQLFNKSGQGNVFDFTSYSDKTKNVPAITSPSLTIIGESTPSSFYSCLDETMILDGLLPRFFIIEYTGLNPYFHENHQRLQPDFDLVEKLAALCAICLGRQAQNTVQNVELTSDAKELLTKYSRFATDQVNHSEIEASASLWNRAHIKALKLAALIAVGINPINPLITLELAQYSTELVFKEITKLVAKFSENEIGNAVNGSSETGQMKDLVRIIREFRLKDYKFWEKYGVKPAMYEAGIIPWASIQRRLVACSSFRLDKFNPTAAIQKQISILLENDDIREIPKSQMNQLFGCKTKAYTIANPDRFKA